MGWPLSSTRSTVARRPGTSTTSPTRNGTVRTFPVGHSEEGPCARGPRSSAGRPDRHRLRERVAEDPPVLGRLLTQEIRCRQDREAIVRANDQGRIDRARSFRHRAEPREVLDFVLDSVPGESARLEGSRGEMDECRDRRDREQGGVLERLADAAKSLLEQHADRAAHSDCRHAEKTTRRFGGCERQQRQHGATGEPRAAVWISSRPISPRAPHSAHHQCASTHDQERPKRMGREPRRGHVDAEPRGRQQDRDCPGQGFHVCARISGRIAIQPGGDGTVTKRRSRNRIHDERRDCRQHADETMPTSFRPATQLERNQVADEAKRVFAGERRRSKRRSGRQCLAPASIVSPARVERQRQRPEGQCHDYVAVRRPHERDGEGGGEREDRGGGQRRPTPHHCSVEGMSG